MINTIEDLFSYLDADYYPDDLERSDRALSRRIYIDTSCGAWAKFGPPGKRRDGHKKETWSCTYEKKDGAWGVVSFAHPSGQAYAFKDANVPVEVYDYFWPDIESISEYIDEQHPNQTRVTITEEVKIALLKEHQGVFVIGSIVEGVDAEVQAEEVYLPCKESDIDDAIKCVEDEAQRIWDDTHGCEKCQDEENEYGFRSINPDCKECGGDGVSI